MVNLKSWAIVIFVLTSLILVSNFITLDRKRNLQKNLNLNLNFIFI